MFATIAMGWIRSDIMLLEDRSSVNVNAKSGRSSEPTGGRGEAFLGRGGGRKSSEAPNSEVSDGKMFKEERSWTQRTRWYGGTNNWG